MDDGWKILITIIVVTGCIVGALILVAGMFYPAGFEAAGIAIESTYTYELTITNSHDLDRFELMVPLPSREGDTPLGNAIVSSGQTEYQSGWNVILVGDEQATFLKISAETLSASASPHRLTATIHSDVLIDTKDPGSDPWQVSPASGMTGDGGKTSYTTSAYARFDAPDTTITCITAASSGRNSWQYPLAGMNSFTNQMDLSITGPSSGWHRADVTIVAGLGKYTLL
jgi:hypothetical protein